MTTTNSIKYREGYKYQLAEDFELLVPIRPERDLSVEYISLNKAGLLKVKEGYAWDGPSGPTVDRPTNMRGSLAHDALYQLIRAGLLPLSARDQADAVLYACWVEDGMYPWLAKAEVWAVDKFAADAARPHSEHRILLAP